MGVDIDPAGQQQLARGVDRFVSLRRQVAPDQRDLFAVDQLIGLDGVAGGDDRAVFDQGSHVASSLSHFSHSH
jgi:hypothetical protein